MGFIILMCILKNTLKLNKMYKNLEHTLQNQGAQIVTYKNAQHHLSLGNVNLNTLNTLLFH